MCGLVRTAACIRDWKAYITFASFPELCSLCLMLHSARATVQYAFDMESIFLLLYLVVVYKCGLTKLNSMFINKLNNKTIGI
jgi:hypothetical protein